LQPSSALGFWISAAALVKGGIGIGSRDPNVGSQLNQLKVLVFGADASLLGKFNFAKPDLPFGKPSLGVAGDQKRRRKDYNSFMPH
jgi:hypothetical protein